MRRLSMAVGVALLSGLALPPPTAAQPVTLEELQRTGRERNPTLVVVQARLEAALADTAQAGLWPNLHAAYQQELVNEHQSRGLFLRQTLPISGRLGAGKAVHAQDADLARLLVAMQRLRVDNSVRLLYRDALMAEQKIALQEDVVALVEEELQTIHQLVNVGLEDTTDVLETEMELQHARLDLNEERLEQRHLWTELAQMVGDPSLMQAPLAGDALRLPPPFDYDMSLARLLEESPELQVAEAEAAVAAAALRFEELENRPDLRVMAGYRYSDAVFDENGLPAESPGWELVLDVDLGGFWWNRNQHGVRAAEEDLAEVRAGIRRTELDLRARFDEVFHEYEVERAEAQSYQDDILPRAEEVHALALGRYEDFGEDYTEVLEARAKMLEVSGKLLQALADAWHKAVLIEGLLLDHGLRAPDLHFLEQTALGSAETMIR